MLLLSIARKGALLVALPLVTQVTFGVALLVVGRNAVDAHAWELHSQKVLERAHNGRSALVEAQSALRGFVISGIPSFRVSCDESRREATTNLTALRPLVADNAPQLQCLTNMSQAANAFLNYQVLNARLVDSSRRAEAEANVSSRMGDRLMRTFLATMDSFLGEERRLALQRHNSAESANRTAMVVVIVGLALNLAVAMMMALFFSSGIKKRLNVLTENARRLATDRPLLAPLAKGDEIAAVDRGFHAMAASLARAIEDLQHANLEMEAFSYSVSHDLRAPLRAIDGFSRMLEEDHGGSLDAEARRLLGVIRNNTATMAQLIDDLLAFSRLSRQQVLPAAVDMNALARHAFADASRGAGDRQIEFVVHDLPPVSGDAAMLCQVFANLFSNAVKFTAPRSIARIEVAAETAGAETVYSVKDNGVGFDARFADKLFGVFQRLHASHEFEGTGVGLAIVQRVVQRHGGRVWAESVLDSGSTFYFTLGRNGEERNGG
ncbi:MAG TPA: ATP-binding protein [Vicinamibacterales bacterium]